MRIALCTQYFWPENFAINHLSRGLVEAGHEVEVLTGMPNYPSGIFSPGYGGLWPKRERFHGIPVVRIPMMARGSSRLSLAFNYLSFALSACLLGPFLMRGRFDVVFVFSPSPVTVGLPGLVLKWTKRAKLAFWVQDLWPESLSATGGTQSRLLTAIARWLVQLIYRGSDRILIPSEGFRRSVETLGGAPAKIDFVANTVEDFYRPVGVPADAPERSEIGEGGFRIVFGGNLGDAQDLDTVLAAAGMTCVRGDIKWILVGGGRMSDHVAEEVRRLGLNDTVTMLGQRPPEAMPTYFALADALLLTLRDEPIYALTVPSRLQAYLACGRPVLAGINGEAARIVTEAGAGLAARASSPEALARTAMKLADMPRAEREAMGKAARDFFKRTYARDEVLRQLGLSLRKTAEGD